MIKINICLFFLTFNDFYLHFTWLIPSTSHDLFFTWYCSNSKILYSKILLSNHKILSPGSQIPNSEYFCTQISFRFHVAWLLFHSSLPNFIFFFQDWCNKPLLHLLTDSHLDPLYIFLCTCPSNSLIHGPSVFCISLPRPWITLEKIIPLYLLVPLQVYGFQALLDWARELPLTFHKEAISISFLS